MKRKILIVIYIILILIIAKFLYNYVANSILINKYNDGRYSERQAKALTYLNFMQPYIANYNYGNIFYHNGKYESAMEEYKKALNGRPPKDRECDIRINYALAICKTVFVDEKDQISITNAINLYESATNVLTENGCASNDKTVGHNHNSEQLKEDIQKEIDRLKNLQQNQENKHDNKEDEKDDNNTKEQESIEEKIQNIKENATKEQRENEQFYRDTNKEFVFDGKNW